jgi:hypothetical protein
MQADTATTILLAGAFAMLAAGFATGALMGRVRAAAPTVNKYLRFAHLSGYQQAPILLGLVVAVQVSDWQPWLDTVGAALVVVGAILLTAKDLVNYARGVSDEFRERGPGYVLGAVMAPVHVAGIALLAVGALT